MKILTVSVGMLSTNCYIVYDDETKNAIVIDPGSEGKKILNIIKENNLNVKYILFTHGHFDHILGVYEIKEAFPDAVTAIGKNDVQALSDTSISLVAYSRKPYVKINHDMELKENDEIILDSIKLKVLETPGHTKGGVSYYFKGGVFSGDVLFYHSIGRTDFATGNLSEEISSIKNVLFKLPPDTVVYPGHGEKTSIYEEMNNNEELLWR